MCWIFCLPSICHFLSNHAYLLISSRCYSFLSFMPISHTALFVVFICSRVPYSLLLQYKMFSFYFSFFLEFYHICFSKYQYNHISCCTIFLKRLAYCEITCYSLVFFLLLFCCCFLFWCAFIVYRDIILILSPLQ